MTSLSYVRRVGGGLVRGLAALVVLLALTAGAHAAVDLVVDLRDSVDPVSPSGTFTYVVIVTNKGTTTSAAISAVHTFQAGTTVLGSTTCSPAMVAGSTTCALPALAGGASTTYSVTVRAPSSTATLQATVKVNGGTSCTGETTCVNNVSGETTTVNGNQCADNRGTLVALDDSLVITKSGNTCAFGRDFTANPCEGALTTMGNGLSQVLILDVQKIGYWLFTVDDAHEFMLTTACPDVATGSTSTNPAGNYCLRNLGSGGVDASSENIYIPEPGRYFLQITSYPGSPNANDCGAYTLSIKYNSGNGTGNQDYCAGGGFIEGDPLDLCLDNQLSLQAYFMGRPLAFGSGSAASQGAPNNNTGRGGADIGIDVWVQNTLGQSCIVAPEMNVNANSSRLIATPKWGATPTASALSSLTKSGTGTDLDPWVVTAVKTEACATNQPAVIGTETIEYSEGQDYADVTLKVCGDLTHQGGTDVSGGRMKTGDLAGAPVVFFCGLDQWEDATKNGNPTSDYNGSDPKTTTYLQVDNLSDVTGTPTFGYPFGYPSTYSSTVQRLEAVDRTVSCVKQDAKSVNDWAHLRTPYSGSGCAMSNGVVDSTADQVGIMQFGAGKGTAETVGKLLAYDASVGFSDKSSAASHTTTADITNPLPATADVGDCVYFGRVAGGFEYLAIDIADLSGNAFNSVCVSRYDGTWLNKTTAAADSTAGDITAVIDLKSPLSGVFEKGVYFGAAAPFRSISYNVSTATGNTTAWNGRVKWQYWSGSGWVALSGVSDPTNGFRNVGLANITYTFPTGWAPATLPSPMSATCTTGAFYYIRAVVDDVGTAGSGAGAGTEAWPGPYGGYTEWSGSLAWQYSKAGGAWGALADVVDRSEAFTKWGPANASVAHVDRTVSFTYPVDWASATVNGSASYWVRACVTSAAYGGGGTWDAVDVYKQTDANLVGQTAFFGADNCAQVTCRIAASTLLAADVSITKRTDHDPIVIDDTLTYTLTVHNSGPAVAEQLVVTDVLPAGLTYTGPVAVLYSGDATAVPCEQVGYDTHSRTLTCVLRNLLYPASDATLTFPVAVAHDAASYVDAQRHLVNTASVTLATADPDRSNNTATATSTLTLPASLSTTKTASPTTVSAGSLVTYTITVANAAGVGTATATTVSEVLPTDFTVVSTSGCAEASPAYPTCSLGTIAAGASKSFTLVASVGASRALGAAVNFATASTASGDLDASDDTGSASVDVIAVSDLSITKTDGHTTYTPGLPITYTVVVHNAGPKAAVGASVSDPLPAPVSAATWTCAASAGATCAASGSGAIADTVTLPVGGDVTYTVVAATRADATASLVNTATVAVPVGYAADPTPGDDTASDTDTASPSADLELAKSGAPSSTTPGAHVTYTLTVTNHGPSDAAGVVVSDALPAGFTYDAGSTVGCAEDGATGGYPTCTLGALAAGASRSYTLRATATGVTGTADYANSAMVSATTADPTAGNDGATATTHLRTSDLAITKTDGRATYTPGRPTTYTLVVTNRGPDAATGATVRDLLPATVTSAAWTCAASSGASCAPSGTGSLVDTVTLPVDGTVTYTVVAETDPDALVDLVNTATVEVPAGSMPDPTPGDASATDVDTATPSADLALAKSASPSLTIPGGAVTYTLTVTNRGPSRARAVEVLDLLPTTPAAFVVAGAGTLGCVNDGGAAGGTPTCALGDLAAGATASYTLFATAGAAEGDYVNLASVASTTPDGAPGDESASATVTVTTDADLAITKTGAAEATAGTELTYTITVSNAGPAAATHVAVLDLLPAGVTYVADSLGCGAALTACALPDLAPGASQAFTVTVAVAASTLGPIANTVAVASDDDPFPDNDEATATTTVTGRADLRVVKVDDPDPVTAGGVLDYAITVTNDGPSDALDVVASELLPTGVTFVSTTGCAPASGVPDCALGTLAAGASATYHVQVTVAPDAPTTLTNRVTVTASTADPDPSDDEALAETAVARAPGCEGTACDVATTWLPLLDANNEPIGALRCHWDGDDAPTCDTDATGALVIYPSAHCGEVAP